MGLRLLLALVPGMGAMRPPPTVVIPGLGAVAGIDSYDFPDDVVAFLGIPYGKPPVDGLRWQPPLPYGAFPTPGPLQAATFGHRCMQPASNGPETSAMAEDCLFLNVAGPTNMINPGKGRKLLPTIVWIHGGGYVSGQSNDYISDALVAKNNNSVVVVTINYRLSIFGFLGGAAIAKRTANGTQGNFGIDDQRLAITWVREHIAAFGGDGHNIMIVGESAGGNSVLNHLATPDSFGLYKRAGIESGVYDAGAKTAAVAETQYSTALTAANCTGGGLGCLLNATPAALIKVIEKLDTAKVGSHGWGPVVDGVRLVDTPLALVSAGRYNTKVPVLLGSNRDEMAYWSIASVDNQLTEAGFDELVAVGVVGKELAELKQLYDPKSYPYPDDLGLFSQWWWTLMRIYTDAVPGLGTCGVRSFARKLEAGGTPASFAYLFAHPTTSRNYSFMPGQGPGAVTVPHASEIQYVFNAGALLTPGPEADLATPVSQYWANFARSGNPNIPATPAVKWPTFTTAGDQLLRLDAATAKAGGIEVQTGLRKAACDHWDQKGRARFAGPLPLR